jgi:hypothetical protein
VIKGRSMRSIVAARESRHPMTLDRSEPALSTVPL